MKHSIYLIGPTASGKSTLAPLLAKNLSLPWCDLDQEVEKIVGTPIPEYFRRHGRAAFRRREEDALRALNHPVVVATGAGIVEQKRARWLMRQSGVIVHLDSIIKQQKRNLRTPGQRRARPLIATKLTHRLQVMRRKRTRTYRALATIHVSLSLEQPTTLAKRIGWLLASRGIHG